MGQTSESGTDGKLVVISYQPDDVRKILDNREKFDRLLGDEHFRELLSLIGERVLPAPLHPRTCRFVMAPKTGDAYIFQVVSTTAKDEIENYFKRDSTSGSSDDGLLPIINSEIKDVVDSLPDEIKGISARAQYIKTFGDGVVQAAGLGREWSSSDKGKCWAVYAHLF